MLWKPHEPVQLDAQVEEWLQKNHIPPIFGPILARRGVKDVSELDMLFFGTLDKVPTPHIFGEEMQKGVERLGRAMKNKEKIVIVGDYDVDGTTGTAVVMTVLERLMSHYGFEVEFMLPDRFTEGYGLNDNNIGRVLAMKPNLVITVDCGVSSSKQIDELLTHGIDTIVTDHHEPKADFPQHAYAVIHPMYCQVPFHGISGCAVAYQFMRGIWECQGKKAPDWVADDMLDLVALGAVCDIMPLQRENRIWVREGMKRIFNGKRLVFRIMKDLYNWRKVTTYTLGFTIGPRINAAGRMKDADPVVRMLLSNDFHSCSEILQELENRNKARKEAQNNVVERGMEQAKNSPYKHVLAIIDDEFHEGVVGIAASRFVEEFYRPTFVMARHEGQVKGSARSIEGVHLFHYMEKHQHLIGKKWGGHAAAAGLTFDDENTVDAFFKALDEDLATLPPETWVKVHRWEAKLEEKDLTHRFFELLLSLEPFGQNFPEPIWCIEGTLVPGKELGEEKKIGKLRIGNKVLPFAMWDHASRAKFNEQQTYYGVLEWSDYWKSLQFVAKWVE